MAPGQGHDHGQWTSGGVISLNSTTSQSACRTAGATAEGGETADGFEEWEEGHDR